MRVMTDSNQLVGMVSFMVTASKITAIQKAVESETITLPASVPQPFYEEGPGRKREL